MYPDLTSEHASLSRLASPKHLRASYSMIVIKIAVQKPITSTLTVSPLKCEAQPMFGACLWTAVHHSHIHPLKQRIHRYHGKESTHPWSGPGGWTWHQVRVLDCGVPARCSWPAPIARPCRTSHAMSFKLSYPPHVVQLLLKCACVSWQDDTSRCMFTGDAARNVHFPSPLPPSPHVLRLLYYPTA